MTGMKTKLTAGLAVAAAIYLVVWPIYSGLRTMHATLLAVDEKVVITELFPVVIALVPLAFPTQAVRVVAAILIGGFALVAMSIGLLYLPAAIMMVLAACVGDGATLRDAVP